MERYRFASTGLVAGIRGGGCGKRKECRSIGTGMNGIFSQENENERPVYCFMLSQYSAHIWLIYLINWRLATVYPYDPFLVCNSSG